jgi:hypothetical protein
VYKKDVFAIGAPLRTVVQDPITSIREPLAVRLQIVRAEGKMVQPWSPLFQKPGDGRRRVEGFQQFDLGPARIEEIRAYSLGCDLFRLVGFSAEQGAEVLQTGFDIAYGDAYVLQDHGKGRYGAKSGSFEIRDETRRDQLYLTG